MSAIQIPTIRLPGELLITAGSWVEADAADPSAVLLTFGSGHERKLNAEQSEAFLQQAAALPLFQLGELFITAGAWVMIDAADRDAVVITYGSWKTRTLTAEQSAAFVVRIGLEKPRLEVVGGFSRSGFKLPRLPLLNRKQ